MSLDALTFSDPQFHSTPELVGGTLVLRLDGEIALDITTALKRILEAVHTEAVAQKVTEVVLDLTQLEFLNSSGIKHFVTWLQVASDLPEDAGYRIRIVGSATFIWQRRCFETLRCFAPRLVSVETRAA